eukprot:c48219_g1_i1 orf=289-1056(+)
MQVQQLPLRTNHVDRHAPLFSFSLMDKPCPGIAGTRIPCANDDGAQQITTQDTFLIQRQPLPVNDLYFINKSIAVPFKWEAEPGRAKLQIDIPSSLYPLRPPPGKGIINSGITLSPNRSRHHLVHSKLKDALMGRLCGAKEKDSYNYSALEANYTVREPQKLVEMPGNLFACIRPAKSLSLGKVSLAHGSEALVKRRPALHNSCKSSTVIHACNQSTQQSRCIYIGCENGRLGSSSASVKLHKYTTESHYPKHQL